MLLCCRAATPPQTPTEVPAHGDVAALKAELCLIGLNGRSKETCLEDEGVRQVGGMNSCLTGLEQNSSFNDQV